MKMLEKMMTQMLTAGQTAAMVTPTTAKAGTATAVTVQMLEQMQKQLKQRMIKSSTKLLTRRGLTRRVNVVDGVEYSHRNSTECIQFAQERAGASLLGYLYRFEWDRSHDCLKLIAYRIAKKTPKGWQIFLGRAGFYQSKETRLVIDGTMRQFARSSVDAALESYKRRKTRYVSILEHQLMSAKQALIAANLPQAYPSPDLIKKRELAFLIEGEVFTS